MTLESILERVREVRDGPTLVSLRECEKYFGSLTESERSILEKAIRSKIFELESGVTLQ